MPSWGGGSWTPVPHDGRPVLTGALGRRCVGCGASPRHCWGSVVPDGGVSWAVIRVTGQVDGSVPSPSLCGVSSVLATNGGGAVRPRPACSRDRGGDRVDGPAAIAGRGHGSLETLSGLQWGKWPFPRGRLVTAGSVAPDSRGPGTNHGPLPLPGWRTRCPGGPALPDRCSSGRQRPRGCTVLGTAGVKWPGRHRCLAKTEASLTWVSSPRTSRFGHGGPGLAPLWPASLASALGHARPWPSPRLQEQRWIVSSGSEARWGRAQPSGLWGSPPGEGPSL